MTSDRSLSRGILEARKQIVSGEFTRAIRFLNEVLQRDQDYFVQPGDLDPVHEGGVDGRESLLGLKEAARRMIRDLAPEGRAAYKLAYQASAQRQLETAIATNDLEQLSQVVRQYYYTPAGYEAALLLAQLESDHGRHLSAALGYQLLLDTPDAAARFNPQLSVLCSLSWMAAGNSSRARQPLELLLQQDALRVHIAGMEHRLPSEPSDLIDWLRKVVGQPVSSSVAFQSQWLTYLGNASRNSQVEGGLPHLRAHWKSVPLLTYHNLESLYDDTVVELRRQARSTEIAAFPLAIGDTVITRSVHGLLAFDFNTGKLIWRAGDEKNPMWEAWIRSNAAGMEEGGEGDPARMFARHLWKDRLFGVLSSDGERVFAIENLQIPELQVRGRWQAPVAGGPRGRAGGAGRDAAGHHVATNHLSAYELETEGRLAWQLDGISAPKPLQGAFFLGAPLSIDQSLYCLAEIKSAIFLVAIEAQSGQFQWLQQLVSLESGIQTDSLRRLQSTTPSYDSGVLVCPTGVGMVVGIDLSKRSFAWAYRYPGQKLQAHLDPRLLLDESGEAFLENSQGGHWSDNAPVIAGERVLLTPPESDFLHCLDLRTGTLQWKRPRNGYRRVACVEEREGAVSPSETGRPQGRLLLVGDTKLTALGLHDGEPVWEQGELDLPPGAEPSGQGFFSHGQYYLPLSTAEVAAIDLAHGEISSRAISRDGQVLGNLICHREAVLSQTGRWLDRFDQVDVLRQQAEQQLAADRDHVESLRILGEIAYNEQHLPEAVELLVRAHHLRPDDYQVAEVLRGCLFTALEEDFSTYGGRLGLLSQLIDDRGSDLLQLLRIKAEGLFSEGHLLEAVDVCLRIYREVPDGDATVRIGKAHQVRIACWCKVQIHSIWQAASTDERETILEKLRVAQPSSTGSSLAAREISGYLHYFGSLDHAEPLWLDEARRLLEKDPLPKEEDQRKDERQLQAQQILLSLLKSGQAGIRNTSIALLARQLHESGLHQSALVFDRCLSGPLADTTCLDGKTGAECVAAWAGDLPGGSNGSLSLRDWPYGKVEVTTEKPTSSMVSRGQIPAPLWGIRLERTDPILGMGNVLMSLRNSEIFVKNSLGHLIYRTSVQSAGRNIAHYRSPGHACSASRGSLLLVSMGGHLIACNTLASDNMGMGESPSGLLWREEMVRNFNSILLAGHALERNGTSEVRRPGSYRAPRWLVDNRWVGVVGPVTFHGCVYQDLRRLISVDPVTGSLNWSRDDVPPGCDLFGDDRYLFVAPGTGSIAHVFSSMDGRRIGSKPIAIPAWNQRLATMGRQIICWRKRVDQRRELASVDALTGKTHWSYLFENKACVDIDRGRFIGVVQRSGECAVIDAVDGRLLVRQTGVPCPILREIHLIASSDRFTLLVNHSKARSASGLRGLIPADGPLMSGHVYQFERRVGQFEQLLGQFGHPMGQSNQVLDPTAQGDEGGLSDPMRGRSLWNRPATIGEQAFILTQPRDLPVVIFASIQQKRDVRGARPGLSMLLLEKATGRTLLRKTNLPNTGGSYLAAKVGEASALGAEASAAFREVTIEMTEKVVRLKFTSQSRPPQPPAMFEVEAPSKKRSKGLMGILRKLGGGE